MMVRSTQKLHFFPVSENEKSRHSGFQLQKKPKVKSLQCDPGIPYRPCGAGPFWCLI